MGGGGGVGGGGGGGIDNLVAARRELSAGLDKSRAVESALARSGHRLGEIRKRLPSLDAAARFFGADERALASAAGHIARAVGPAVAVLKLFDAVHGLERPLLADPRADLPCYLAFLRSFEEALRLLSENCGVAVRWLDDIVEYIDDHHLADRRLVGALRTALDPAKSPLHPLDGGLIATALYKIESEFHRLLSEHTVPLQMTRDDVGAPTIAPSPLPVAVVNILRAILERAAANNRLDGCISIYVDVRGSNIGASLLALDLEYLEITSAEFNGVQSIEGYIQKWGQHLEFAVKHIFEAEFKVCVEVFELTGPLDVAVSCFARIAAQAGILAFLRFGKTVAETKKDPIKLLKLLDIFSTLDKLRVDFNRLFGGKACSEIQNQTRDLVKRVVDGACEIFWEILHQVELQRKVPPPSNGAVPRFVTFVTDYCNKLLSEEYFPVLTQVLIIHQSWKKEKYQEGMPSHAILDIFAALEANFMTWFRSYQDAALSHLFAMNMYLHFYKNLKGTKLGVLLGEPKLKEYERSKDSCAEYFLRASWGNLPLLLRREGLTLFSGGKAKARDLLNKRLEAYYESFDIMYQKQLNWVISDKELREKFCQMIVQTTVPSYQSYLQNYGSLLEQDVSPCKYVKYTVHSLEKMLCSLFLQRTGRTMSLSMKHSNGKLNNMLTELARSSTVSG